MLDVRIAGVDEAGKGAVIGSLFVAGVAVRSSAFKYLERMGVKDSKGLSHNRRELLSKRIERIGAVRLHEITARQIDELRTVMTMNDIIVRGHGQILRNLDPDMAYVDAADVDTTRFSRRVQEKSGISSIVAEHHADTSHVIVSAASIIAKVARDKSIEALKRKLKLDIGSGYPSDSVTVAFLERWLQKHGELPPETRRSWKTVQKLLNSTQQSENG
jgi:ribonuclease HII